MFRSAVSYAMGLVDVGYTELTKLVAPAEDVFFDGGYGDLSNCVRARQAIEAAAWEGRLVGEPVELKFGERHGAGVREATFRSPLAEFLPPEARTAHALVMEPARRPRGTVVLFAATGDSGYSYRQHMMGGPLVARGYAVVVLEVALYGNRQPAGQHRYFWRTLACLSMTSLACSAEGAALAEWARRAYDGAPVCFSGASYGGCMAVAASLVEMSPEPLAVVTYVAPPSPHTMLAGGLSKQVAVHGVGHDRDAMRRAFSAMDVTDTDAAAWMRRSVPGKKHYSVCVVASHDFMVLPSEAERLVDLMRELSTSARHRRYGVSGGHVTAFALARFNWLHRIDEAFELLERDLQQ